MKQALLISTLFVAGLCSCEQNYDKLLGSWDNKNGQVLEFQPNGEALWIFHTEAHRDTFEISYKFDHTTTPNHLDLTGFKVGPLKGKSLYGIIEVQSDSSFRFDCEPNLSNRPETFNLTQTQTYHKRQ